MTCFTPGCDGDASSVLRDTGGIRRAVCGECAGAAVTSARWVAVVPIEAVGVETMERLRASGHEARIV